MAFEPLQDIEGFVPLAPSASVPEDREAYKAYARQVAQREGIPEDLFQGYFHMESGWNPKAKNPGSSATGIGQIMATNPWARQKGMTVFDRSESDSRWDPYHSIESIAHEVKDKYKNTGDWTKAFTFVGEGTPGYRKKLLASAQLYRDGGTGSVDDGFVPLAPESGFVPLEGGGDQAKAVENFVMEQQPLPVVEMAQKFLEKGEEPSKETKPSEGILPDVWQGAKGNFVKDLAGLVSLIDPASAMTGAGVMPDAETLRLLAQAPESAEGRQKDIVKLTGVDTRTPEGAAGMVGKWLGRAGAAATTALPFGAGAAVGSLPGLVGWEAGAEAAEKALGEGLGAHLAGGLLGAGSVHKAGKLAKGLLSRGKTGAAQAYGELQAAIEAEPGRAPELISDFSKKWLKPGQTMESLGEVGEALKIPIQKVPLDSTEAHAERIKALKVDLPERRIGRESKWSAQTKTFMFDELEEISPGIKQTIYHPMKEAENVAFREFQEFEGASRALDKGLPKGSQERIYAYAVAQQEGGPETLARMKIKPPAELTGAERQAYDWYRGQFENLWTRINEARASMGMKPLAPEKNYFTFARDITYLNSIGVSPLSEEAAKFLTPGSLKFNYFKERVDSTLPLVMDAGKVARRYAKAATKWINVSPEIKKTKDFAQEIAGTAPRAAVALDQWVKNITGVSGTAISEWGDRVIMGLNNRLTAAGLAGNLRSALIQPTSMLNSAAVAGVGNVMKGLGQVLTKGELSKIADAHSSVLKTREFDTSVQHVLDLMGSRNKFEIGRQAATKTMLKPLQMLDELAAKSTWIGFYLDGQSKGLTGQKLWRYADDWTIKTQASAAKSDVANIQTHTLGKALTLFQTFVINDWNFLRKEIFGLGNKALPRGENLSRALKWTMGAALINSLYEGTAGVQSPLPAPIEAFGRSVKRGEQLPRNLIEAGKEIGAQVPVIGGAFKRPGGGVGGAIGQLGIDISKLIHGEGSVSPYELAGRLLGAPGTAQIKRLLDPRLDWVQAIMGNPPEFEKPKSIGLKGFSMKPQAPSNKPEILKNLEEPFKRKR